jgi:hypothetical protein
MRLADALKHTADAHVTADLAKADAAAALAEIQALKPDMMAGKMAKHHTDAIGDLSEAEYGARKAGYWGLRVTMESHLARCAVGFSQRRKARCLSRGAAPSMAFRIGLPITSASTRRRSSETPGFFRPTDVALPLPFRIWTFALGRRTLLLRCPEPARGRGAACNSRTSAAFPAHLWRFTIGRTWLIRALAGAVLLHAP